MNRRGVIAIIAAVTLALAGGALYLGLNRAQSSDAASEKPITVYLANADIPVGTGNDKIAALIVAKQVPGNTAEPGAITDIKQIEGRQVISAIPKGKQLVSSMFATAEQAAASSQATLPSGTVEIAVQLNALQSVGGQLKAGGTVSVFVTAAYKSSESGEGVEATRRVASKVMITKVVSGTATPVTAPQPAATTEPTSTPAPTTAPSRQPAASSAGMMLLLAVTPNDAARLIMAAKSGTITLARENDGSSVNAGQSAIVTVDKVLG